MGSYRHFDITRVIQYALSICNTTYAYLKSLSNSKCFILIFCQRPIFVFHILQRWCIASYELWWLWCHGAQYWYTRQKFWSSLQYADTRNTHTICYLSPYLWKTTPTGGIKVARVAWCWHCFTKSADWILSDEQCTRWSWLLFIK